MPNSDAEHRDHGKSATDARQGETPGVVRWVLAISLVLVIIAMIAAYKVF